MSKGFGVLEDLKFLERSKKGYRVSTLLDEKFLGNEEVRRKLFAEAILKVDSFCKFLEILVEHSLEGASLSQLGTELRSKIGADWKDGTAETNAKIMIDWARHTRLAPGVFSETRRGRRKRKQAKKIQLPQTS